MLNSLRQNLKEHSWPKWLLGLVAASLTLYLGAYFSCDSPARQSGNWAAMIDGDPIPIPRVQSVARRIDDNYRQLLGTNYSQYRQQFQIGTQALQQVLEQQLILRDAQSLGLSVSDDELIEEIRGLPELADPSGQFIGKQQYERQINRVYRGGVTAFEQDVVDSLLIDKWTSLVSQAVSIDETELEALYRERNEKTAIDYVIVRSADQDVSPTISDDEVRRYYEDHAEKYMREAGRRVRYLVVERRTQLEGIELSDADIDATYQANQSRYSHPEQRRARHILLKLEPGTDDVAKSELRRQAEQILESVRNGADFDALARERSQDSFSGSRGGDLDWFGRGQMVPPFEEAVFGTEPGQLAPLTETQFGFHIIEVTGTRDAGVRPLDEVRQEVTQQLRLERAEATMLDEAERLRGRVDAGEGLAAVASSEGLEAKSGFVSPSDGLNEIGASDEFRSSVMELPLDVTSAPLRVAQGVAIVIVDEEVPESVAPLDEVRVTVRTDLMNDQSREAALSVARGAVDSDGSFDRVAKALDLEVQNSGDLAPGQTLPGTGGSPPEVRQALFGDDLSIGHRSVVEIPSGALVFEITGREPFDPAAFAAAQDALRDELLNQRRFSIRRSIVDQLSRQSEIEINQPLIDGLDGTSNAG